MSAPRVRRCRYPARTCTRLHRFLR